MTTQLRLRVAALACAGAALVAGCSSGSGDSPAPPSGPVVSSGSVAQWWHGNSYCTILRQTLKAGSTPLSGVSAGDPALLAATTSFMSALQKSAPDEVRSSWAVYAPALEGLIKSGGKLAAMPNVDPQAVAAAAKAIATDAKSRCHVDLSQ